MSNNLRVIENKEAFAQMLDRIKDRLVPIVAGGLSAEKVMALAMVAAAKNPDLYDCTPQSVLQAVMASSQLGLDCTGSLGHGYMVPFNHKCTFIIGYRGMIELAKRGGDLDTIHAHVVYEGDEFSYELGAAPAVHHRPTMGTRGKVIAAYAVARLRAGGFQLEVMTYEDIEEIRSRSKLSHKGPWVTDWREMARKTVIRRIFKYLSAGVELSRAIEYDNECAGLESPVVADARPRADRLMDRLGGEPVVIGGPTDDELTDPPPFEDYDEPQQQ